VWLEADIHRVDCRTCRRVRTEQVPWARPNARHTSDFENVVAWLAQRMDKTSIGRLLRCSWEAVDAIVARVVVDHIDDSRLNHLYRIGVDEISYKRGHRFLTIVADHDTGNVVWVGKQASRSCSHGRAATAAEQSVGAAISQIRCLRSCRHPCRRRLKNYPRVAGRAGSSACRNTSLIV
jgi:transposase